MLDSLFFTNPNDAMTNPPALPFRSPLLMNADDTAVVVVDVQAKLVPAIDQAESLIQQIKKLTDSAEILDVPTFFTRQYPQGLGDTVAELQGAPSRDIADSTFDKQMFSFRQCEPLLHQLQKRGVGNVVIAGIEAHICVLQSALDCIAYGFNVLVVADAVGSRNPEDRTIALRRLEMSGVTLTTTESAIFEWCETADHPQFKSISQRVK